MFSPSLISCLKQVSCVPVGKIIGFFPLLPGRYNIDQKLRISYTFNSFKKDFKEKNGLKKFCFDDLWMYVNSVIIRLPQNDELPIFDRSFGRHKVGGDVFLTQRKHLCRFLKKAGWEPSEILYWKRHTATTCRHNQTKVYILAFKIIKSFHDSVLKEYNEKHTSLNIHFKNL